MAQEINSIINSLTSMKPKIEKLAKNNELINIIDDLNDLIADAESFGGVIKQLVPVQLKAQVDALTGVYNQLKTISKSASTAVDNIIDNVDNIPIGQLRKKSMKSIADEGQEDYGVDDYIDTTPNTAIGAQSAIRHESTSLSDYYKSNFRENRAMKSSAKFSWDNIRADFEETNNDLGALGKVIKENKSFAPVDQLGDIFKHLSETAENAAQDAVDDDFMEFDESEIVDGATAFTESEESPKATSGFNWKKMAESAGADMLRGIMESNSLMSGANIDISSAEDVAGDAIKMARSH